MSKSLKNLFILHAAVCILFGLAMSLVPDLVASLTFWGPFDPPITRLLGASLLAIGISSWLGSLASKWEEVKILIQFEVAFTLLSALICFYEVLFAGAQAFLWVGFFFYAAFCVGWIYFLRRGSA